MCWHLQFETLFERLLLIDGRHILAALRQLLPSQLPNIPHRRFRPRCRQVGRVGHSNLGPIGCEFRSSDRIQPTFSGLLDQTARQLPADLVGLAPQLFVALVHGSEQGREQRVVLVCGIVEKECAVALRWAVPFGRLFGAVAVGRTGTFPGGWHGRSDGMRLRCALLWMIWTQCRFAGIDVEQRSRYAVTGDV